MKIKIYYDGDCFFCNQYSQYIKLKSKFEQVNLISLRDDPEAFEKFKKQNLNPNNGFIVQIVGDDNIFYGDKAFKFVNDAIDHKNFFSIFLKIISLKYISKLSYGLLVFLRYFFLIIQGLPIIDSSRDDEKKTMLSRSIRISSLILFVIINLKNIFFNLYKGQNLFDNYNIYNLFLSIAFLIIAINSFKNGKIFLKIRFFFQNISLFRLITYICLVKLFIDLENFVFFRRFEFAIFCFPIVAIFFDIYLKKNKIKKYSLFLSIFLFLSILPGLYIPPFYNGIFGWYSTQKENTVLEIDVVELKNLNNETIFYNHALNQPITQIGRLYLNWDRNHKNYEDYLFFLFENYERNFEYLVKGYFPHMKFFGALSYPTHNLSKNNAKDYVKKFKPEDIVEILETNYKIDRTTKKIISKKINYSIKIN